MPHLFPQLIHGTFTFFLLTVNTLFFATCLLAIIPFKVVAPSEKLKRYSSRVMEWLAQTWVDGNTLIFRLTQKTQWDIKGLSAALGRNGWYLIMSNHRSWADIIVLLSVFNRKIPFLKFFIKQELLWFPLLGPIWWASDYPVMKRYSKEYLRKNPQEKEKIWRQRGARAKNSKRIPYRSSIFWRAPGSHEPNTTGRTHHTATCFYQRQEVSPLPSRQWENVSVKS